MIRIQFQFQYGAIEGIPDVLLTAILIEFQFQYGAIEGQEHSGLVPVVKYFNSSMVRLREG
jgi:hypothetical protein